jgi:hypothetical protein
MMEYFKCTRCKRKLPPQARAMGQAMKVDFCVDCKRSDLKDAEQYFRNGQWKRLPKYIEDLANQELKER